MITVAGPMIQILTAYTADSFTVLFAQHTKRPVHQNLAVDQLIHIQVISMYIRAFIERFPSFLFGKIHVDFLLKIKLKLYRNFLQATSAGNQNRKIHLALY